MTQSFAVKDGWAALRGRWAGCLPADALSALDDAVGFARLRHGEHVTIAGAKHEVMMETDALRDLFWQAFDRLAKDVSGR